MVLSHLRVMSFPGGVRHLSPPDHVPLCPNRASIPPQPQLDGTQPKDHVSRVHALRLRSSRLFIISVIFFFSHLLSSLLSVGFHTPYPCRHIGAEPPSQSNPPLRFSSRSSQHLVIHPMSCHLSHFHPVPGCNQAGCSSGRRRSQDTVCGFCIAAVLLNLQRRRS
ncbi:hypothetical protein EDB81DRAFT_271578 [Dactylonectria macrodidyma]|uniref:Transmembrane protein n=1 Tax=Dactylonectria macrodidyma TaxID=307937 RepID=A0A9P9FN61_9HYPO|nr:hypothetical protein EDB81DRAFT_271578 [Dactylonectria macrodidyma]